MTCLAVFGDFFPTPSAKVHAGLCCRKPELGNCSKLDTGKHIFKLSTSQLQNARLHNSVLTSWDQTLSIYTNAHATAKKKNPE